MARSLFARMFARSADRGEQRRAGRFGVYEEGPPGVLGRLPFTQSKDPWTVEWNRRRQSVVEQYWRDKRRLQRKKRYAQRDLKERLRREKEEIDRYYRLHELDRNDPRRGRAAREARRRYRLAERKLERKHRDSCHDDGNHHPSVQIIVQ